MTRCGNGVVYVIDDWTRPNGPTRNWDEIVGLFDKGGWDRRKKSLITATGQEIGEGIIVAHRTFINDYSDTGLEELTSYVRRCPGMICVVISGGVQTDHGVLIPERLFVQRSSVPWPAPRDYRLRFQRFVNALRDNKVDFQLLEAEPPPECLMAVYLIASVAQMLVVDMSDPSVAIEHMLSPEDWNRAHEQLAGRAEGMDTPVDKETLAGKWPQSIFVNGKPRAGVIEALRHALNVAA